MSEPFPEIRLVALDVDGTLLRPDKSISPRVARAIASASARVPVVLASARPPRSLRAIHEALGLGSLQVNYNGAMVWDRIAERVVSHSPMDAARCAQVVSEARSLVDYAVLSVEHADRWYTDRLDARYTTETGRLFQPDFVGPLSEFAALGATKLMFHAEPADIFRLRCALEPVHRGHVAFIQTDPDLLQLMDARVSKWITLKRLAESLGVAPGNILAVGDNENDIEMIRHAGIGVAMANGSPEALAAADWIAPSNADDGVAAALERFGLA
jgi:5-amino-6-(5-phospho-D-ribitylamino)uracil phosphatase